MRAFGVVALCAVIVALLAAGLSMYRRIETREAEYVQKEAKYRALYLEEQATRELYERATEEIAEIQKNISEISLGDGGTLRLQGDLEEERILSEAGSNDARAQLDKIKVKISQTRDRLEGLEVQLAGRTAKIASLESIVAGLRKDLAERDRAVARLSQRVAELESRVSDLSSEVAAAQIEIEVGAKMIESQSAEIAATRREASTVLCVMGSKDSLMREHIIEEKGGVLGIGQSIVLTGNYGSPYFKALDCGENMVWNLGTEQVRVLSRQPLGSYKIERSGGVWKLHILDPVQFRTEKHLVILID